MTHGTVSQVVARLQPLIAVIQLYMRMPKRAASDPPDPNHETCSLVSGPDVSGVLSDMRSGSAGAIHAWIVPTIKFWILPIGK